MRIVIAGPDGSGKTSVCNELRLHFPESIIIHAVKNQNHFLRSTTFALNVWNKLSKHGYCLSLLGKYFIFYPFEYLENLRRFSFKHPEATTIIYDRHPIDRVIIKHEIKTKHFLGKINKHKFLIEHPLASVLNFTYRQLFPKVDYLFVLLPDAELCFTRSNNHYRSVLNAKTKLDAYKQAVIQYKKLNYNIYPVYIKTRMSIKDVVNRIISQIQAYEV